MSKLSAQLPFLSTKRKMESVEKENPGAERSFYQALKEKYLEDQYCPSNFTVIKPKRNPNHKDAELAHLKTIVVNGSDIASAGICHRRLSDLCPNVTDLDLAFNKLEKWSEVVTILCHLPQLKYVNLSNNPLRIDTADEGRKESLMIETLALNFTRIGINEVLKLSDFLPCLKELQLCGNDYDQLGNIEDGINKQAFKSLESLTFYHNRIQKWSEIWKLRNLPNLKSLIVSDNPLSDLFYSEEIHETRKDFQEYSQNEIPRNNNTDSDSFLPSNQSPTTNSIPPDAENTFTQPQDWVSDVAETFLNEIIDNISQSQHVENDDKLLPNDCCGSEFPMTNYTDKFQQDEFEIDENEPELKGGNDDVSRQRKNVTNEQANNNSGKDILSPVVDLSIPNIQLNQCLTEDHAQNTFVNNSSHVGTVEGYDTNESEGCERNSHETVEQNTNINEFRNANVSRVGCHHTNANAFNLHYDLVKQEEDIVPNDNPLRPFNSLEILCLSNARISCDEELDALSCFPKLCNLRISCNQLYSDIDPDIRRQLYMANLPNVKILNGSEISPSEREKAERHFLRHFMNAVKKPNSYYRLVSKHGPPVELVDIDLKAGFHEWATLTFIYKGEQKFSQKVRVFDSIAKLRLLISQTLELPKRGFIMFFNPCNPIHPEYDRELVELRCENMPMSRYNLSDGDEIHIDKKPLFVPFAWQQNINTDVHLVINELK